MRRTLWSKIFVRIQDVRRFVNGPATQHIAKATWSTAGPQTAGPQNSNLFCDVLIEKSICQSKNRLRGQKHILQISIKF